MKEKRLHLCIEEMSCKNINAVVASLDDATGAQRTTLLAKSENGVEKKNYTKVILNNYAIVFRCWLLVSSFVYAFCVFAVLYLMFCPVSWLVAVVGWCWLEVNVFCFLFSVPETRCAIVCFREKAKRFWIDCGRTFLFLDLCNKGNH